MERVRTSYAFRRERVLLIGEVENKALATQMKLFSKLARKEGFRPGEIRTSEGGLEVSGDAMACINAMTPDGGPPMSPDLKKVTVLHFSRFVYKTGE